MSSVDDAEELVPVNEQDEEYRDDGAFVFSFRSLWRYSGPGILMSIAYLDPGNIEADLQSGAKAGYSLLWVLLWSTILGGFLQCLTARLGVVTGKTLAQVARANLPRPASICLWLLAELAIITSDIQEVIGSAIALHLLFGLQLWIGVLITAADTFTFLFIHHYGVRKLELFFAFLVGTMAVAFAVCFSISAPDGGALLRGLIVPSVTADTAVQAVGQLGAVVMPHNLYLHSALVLSRKIDRTNRAAVNSANIYNAVESCLSLVVSFTINVLVIGVFAAGFYGQPNAADAGLSVAGDLLKERYGAFARTMWGIGLLASGQSSTMTGTLAGQHVMAGYVDLDCAPWIRVCITRMFAIGPAVFVALQVTNGLDSLNELLNVAQSIQLPFALLPLILFSSCTDVLGEYALSRCAQAFLFSVFTLVLGINCYLTQSLAGKYVGNSPLAITAYAFVALLYFGFLAFLVVHVFYRREPSSAPTGSFDQSAPSSASSALATTAYEPALPHTPREDACESPSLSPQRVDERVIDLVARAASEGGDHAHARPRVAFSIGGQGDEVDGELDVGNRRGGFKSTSI